MPLSLSYEDLCENPFSFVLAVARRLGLEPERLRRGYSEDASPYETEGRLPSKAQVTAGYLAHAAAKGGARWPGAAESVRILMRQ